MKQIKTELIADKRYINGKVDVEYYFPELSSALKSVCQDLIHIGLLRASDFKSENLHLQFAGISNLSLFLVLKSGERYCLVNIDLDNMLLTYVQKIIIGHKQYKSVHISSDLISEAKEFALMSNAKLQADVCTSLIDYITDRDASSSSDIKSEKKKQKKSTNTNHDAIANWRKVIENM